MIALASESIGWPDAAVLIGLFFALAWASR